MKDPFVRTMVLSGCLSLALFVAAPFGCAVQQPVQPNVPGAVANRWDQTTFQLLLDAQTVLEGLKPAATTPQLKRVLNDAIASYNAAEQSFKLYEAGSKDPLDQANVQALVAKLTAKIITLQATISGGAK